MRSTFVPFLFFAFTSSIGGISVPPQLDAAKVASVTVPAVVMIKGTTVDQKTVSGSGFIVDSSGTIITNLHVIQNLENGAVRLASGEIYDRFVVRGFDSRRDLAVIQIPAFDLPTVELGNSNAVKVGTGVVLVGNPMGLEGSLSSGIVSGIRERDDGSKVFQTDAAANPGNSGGPMVDAEGKVIGVLTFKLRESENLNFVVPINYARGLLGLTHSYSLADLRQELGAIEDVFEKDETEETETLPTRWKSFPPGTTKFIRLVGNYLYVETPENIHQFGKREHSLSAAELKKSGDIYEGVYKSVFKCFSDRTQKFNTCSMETPVAITSLTATRIEGWAMDKAPGSKFNCRKCKYSKPDVKESFVWIPENP